MTIQVTISSIVGTSPYDLYVCQVDGTDCFYIDRLTSEQLPYVFDIPAPYNNSESYLFKVVDDYGSISTGTTYLYASPTPTATVTPTITPTPTITATVTITPTPSVSQTPGASPSPTTTQTPTNTPTKSQTPTPSVSETPGASPSPTTTETPTNTPSNTPTETPANTPTNNPSPTPTTTETPTTTPTETPTNTPTNNPSPTPTTTETPTTTPTVTSTITSTTTPTITPTRTPTNTPTNTPNPSPTPTNTVTPTNTGVFQAFVSNQTTKITILSFGFNGGNWQNVNGGTGLAPGVNSAFTIFPYTYGNSTLYVYYNVPTGGSPPVSITLTDSAGVTQCSNLGTIGNFNYTNDIFGFTVNGTTPITVTLVDAVC